MVIGAFILGVATNLASSLMQYAYVKRLTPTQAEVLEDLFSQAFANFLDAQSPTLSEEQIVYLGDVLTGFLNHEEVADILLGFALRNDKPDFDALSRQFRDYGGPSRLHNLSLDFKRAMFIFYRELTDVLLREAEQPNSRIANLVILQQNVALRQALHTLPADAAVRPRPVPEPTARPAEQPSSEEPPNYPGCFISHSHQDHDFVRRLYADLTAAGVPCWYAPVDLPIGASMHQTFQDAIYANERTIAVLSKNSISSDWVEDEVAIAREKERSEKRLSLMPIRIDNEVFTTTTAWAGSIRRLRNCGDFTNWQSEEAYAQALARLLRDIPRLK